jgi:hypothetical protein
VLHRSLASNGTYQNHFGILKGNYVVTGLDAGYALSDRLNDTSALVTEDDGKRSLGILS